MNKCSIDCLNICVFKIFTVAMLKNRKMLCILIQNRFVPDVVVIKEDLHEASSTGVTGFSFPLFCEEDVDRLEAAVKMDPMVRRQYIKHLKSLGEYQPSSFAKYVSELFSDLSLYNYCVTVDGNEHTNKKDMIGYDIFTHCLLEAWVPQGLTISKLTELLKSVTVSLSERRQLSNRNRRKRSELIQKWLLKENQNRNLKNSSDQ
nr:uncharacterized protein LOC109403940 isoform X1 [Aedes albopictus]